MMPNIGAVFFIAAWPAAALTRSANPGTSSTPRSRHRVEVALPDSSIGVSDIGSSSINSGTTGKAVHRRDEEDCALTPRPCKKQIQDLPFPFPKYCIADRKSMIDAYVSVEQAIEDGYRVKPEDIQMAILNSLNRQV